MAMICILVVLGLGQVVAYFLAASAISGMTAVIVTQLAAAPLRPVELRTAFALLKKRWRPFLNTSIRMTLRIMLFTLLGVIPGHCRLSALRALRACGADGRADDESRPVAGARTGLPILAHRNLRLAAAVSHPIRNQRVIRLSVRRYGSTTHWSHL